MRFALLIVGLLLAGFVNAQDDQSAERIDPTLEISEPAAINISKYPFLKPEHNAVQLNGADWSKLAAKFQHAVNGDSVFSVVYLGDSHIQADFGGSVLRSNLADEAGSAGRGLIIPFKMAGTNQPNDYSISTGNAIISSRLLKQPWPTPMPFTGIGIKPQAGNISLKIKAEQTFDRIRLVWKGSEPHITAVNGILTGNSIDFENISPAEISISEPQTEIQISISVPNGTALGGILLSNAFSGTFVHSIGNNGATYSTYNQIGGFAAGIAELHPDLVIIALGTNEAFGRFTQESLEADIDILVSAIRNANPNTEILLVTPAECNRKIRRRGSKRRRTVQIVNSKVVTARNIIRDYAVENGIPLYDTYEISGGSGAAAKMKTAKVLGTDGVHYTSAGYRLWGTLLSTALLREFKTNAAEPQVEEIVENSEDNNL